MDNNGSYRLIATGRWFFGIALVAWGIQYLAAGDFVTRVVPWWPAWIPARALWAYLIGAGLIAAGAMILFKLKPRLAALSFAVFALLSFLLLHLPLAVKDMLWGGAWTTAGKALVMSGGAVCIAVSVVRLGQASPGRLLATAAARRNLLYFGRVCLGLFMILAGIQHFLFVKFVATLVPVWIPSAVFWVYFAGVALIAGGAGIILPVFTRAAALLSGIMIFSWVFLVHLPLVWHDPRNTGNVAAVFEALAFSGVAFVIGGLLGRGEDAHDGR
jgi:uncharacterized membrane protein YphA (DoxX/SURF4 family)